MSSRPVVVQLPSGAEYGVADAATAKRLYPQGKVVRYQDGEPIPEPKPKAESPAGKKG